MESIKDKNCLNCSNCLPIGEGDHICNEFNEPMLILDGYVPTVNFSIDCEKWQYE